MYNNESQLPIKIGFMYSKYMRYINIIYDFEVRTALDVALGFLEMEKTIDLAPLVPKPKILFDKSTIIVNDHS